MCAQWCMCIRAGMSLSMCVRTLICVGSRGIWAGIVLAEAEGQHRPAAVSSEFGDSYLVVGGASLQGCLEKRFMYSASCSPQWITANDPVQGREKTLGHQRQRGIAKAHRTETPVWLWEGDDAFLSVFMRVFLFKHQPF